MPHAPPRPAAGGRATAAAGRAAAPLPAPGRLAPPQRPSARARPNTRGARAGAQLLRSFQNHDMGYQIEDGLQVSPRAPPPFLVLSGHAASLTTY
jgi:hypothetical protein